MWRYSEKQPEQTILLCQKYLVQSFLGENYIWPVHPTNSQQSYYRLFETRHQPANAICQQFMVADVK